MTASTEGSDPSVEAWTMKYTYAYKTSDGARHEAAMEAESREAVFAALRAKGVRPIKVVAADGSKANGEVRGIRKRVVAVLVVLAAAVVGGVAYFQGTRTGAALAANPAAVSPRHQIYGDPAIMEGLERGDFAAVLPRVGDQMLAVFAQPGKLMCAKGANPRLLDATMEAALAGYAKDELSAESDISIDAGEERELRELKQIVNGIREEMRYYLANGNGTPRSFWRPLNERTAQEMQIYERTRRELENETSPETWESKNEALRRIGLRTIANPKEQE